MGLSGHAPGQSSQSQASSVSYWLNERASAAQCSVLQLCRDVVLLPDGKSALRPLADMVDCQQASGRYCGSWGPAWEASMGGQRGGPAWIQVLGSETGCPACMGEGFLSRAGNTTKFKS